MQQMGSEGKSYIIQKRTDTNKTKYGKKYRSRINVKETATIHLGNEEEEDKDPAKKSKSEKGGRNGNAFGLAKIGKVI